MTQDAVQRVSQGLFSGRFSGLFNGDWELGLTPYQGPDFSRVCVMFSGQGGASPGLLRAGYPRVEGVRARFEIADALARAEGLPAPSDWVTGPLECPRPELLATRNLAVYTAQVGIFEHLVSSGLVPELITGFSVGEYPALACAGVLSFEDAFRALLARDRACPPEHEAGMLIAVAGCEALLEGVLAPEDFQVSHCNSPAQTVIAMAPERRAAVTNALEAHGLRFKVLEEVPQPYHSPWMQPAAERLRRVLGALRLEPAPPHFPVFSSVTKSFLEEEKLDARALEELLCRQLVEPVDFVRQVEAAYDRGCVSLLEIGPGRVLGHFVRDILAQREHRILDLAPRLGESGTRAAPRRTLSAEESRVFRVLRDALARLTGYEIESISLEDRFEEDLGLDSIKKADIILSVLGDDGADVLMEYDASEISTLGDAVDTLLDAGRADAAADPLEVAAGDFERLAAAWRPGAPPAGASEPRAPVARVRLAALLDAPVGPTALLPVSGTCILTADGSEFPGAPEIEARLERVCRGFEHFQALARSADGGDLDLLLVTTRDVDPLVFGLAAFLKSLRKELPRVFVKHLLLDELPDDAGLILLAGRERLAPRETVVRIQGGVREVETLVPLDPVPATELPDGAVIVAFGGAKGVGHSLLTRLARRGRPHLYLAGRSAREQVADALDALSASTASLHYEALDARDGAAVARLVAQAQREHGRIDLVLNAVGTETSALLATRTLDAMREELDTKVLPAHHVLAAAQACDVGLVVQCSSVVARWGNPGQSVYACANEAVNRLTEKRAREGPVAAISVEWPPWQGVGMTAGAGVRAQLGRMGISLLPEDRAAELLGQDLVRPEHRIVTYADRSQLPLFGAALLDHRALRPVLGVPTRDHRFRRDFDASRDAWLLDHCIDGTSFLPAAVAVTMSLALGGHVRGHACALHDFQMRQPIAVRDEPVPVRLELVATSQGLAVRGRTRVPCFSARLAEPVELAANPLDANPSWRDGAPLYAAGLFFHGPAFQVVHEMALPAEGLASVRVHRSRLLPLLGDPHWDWAALAVEAAFQTLALQTARQRAVMAVPAEVRRVRLAPSFTSPEIATVMLEGFEMRDADAVGDVAVVDALGRTLLKLEGVRLRVLRDLVVRPRWLR